MSRRLTAVNTARRVLAEDIEHVAPGDLPGVVGRHRAAITLLLEFVESLPRSARLAVQHDEEFLNLARAARMEVHAARGSLARLDRFERAMTGMLWPVDAEGGDES